MLQIFEIRITRLGMCSRAENSESLEPDFPFEVETPSVTLRFELRLTQSTPRCVLIVKLSQIIGGFNPYKFR
mgnify:CR=1 FL=1